MTRILMYNIDGKKPVEIKNLCRKLNIGYTDVDKADYGYTLGYLLGENADNTKREGEDFSDEMLYLSEFSDGILNLFLSLLRKRKCPVKLKAVMTKTNKTFTSFELYNEISAEHRALKNGETYHQA